MKKTISIFMIALLATTFLTGTANAAAKSYSGYYLLREKQNYTTPEHEKNSNKAKAFNSCTSIVNATAANWWITPTVDGTTLYTPKKKITSGSANTATYSNSNNGKKGKKVRMAVENAVNTTTEGTISGSINFY